MDPYPLNNNNLSKLLVPSVVSPLKPLIPSDVGLVVFEPESHLHLLLHQHFVAINASIGSVNSELFDDAIIDSHFCFIFLLVVICMLGSFIHILAYLKEFFDSFKEIVELLRVVGIPLTLPLKCKLFRIE